MFGFRRMTYSALLPCVDGHEVVYGPIDEVADLQGLFVTWKKKHGWVIKLRTLQLQFISASLSRFIHIEEDLNFD